MSGPCIRFLGTGTAFNDDGRGSQSLLVERPAARPFLVDVGPTVLPALARADFDWTELERVFVTHLHGDHVAGWPFLLLHLVFRARRAAALDVHGPRGTRECLEGLTRLCYGELEAREVFPIRYHELEVREARGLEPGAEISFDVLPMEHHPTSIGYRLRLGPSGRAAVLAITGDTAWCGNLERLAAGADLLAVECTGLEDGSPLHLSLAEIRRGIDRLASRRIALVHLTDAVAQALALDPLPRVVATHDGMVLPLGAGAER